MYVSQYGIPSTLLGATNHVYFTPLWNPPDISWCILCCCFGHTRLVSPTWGTAPFPAAPTAAIPAYILAAEQRTLDLNAGICFTTEPWVFLIGPPFAVSNSKSLQSPKFHKWLKSWCLIMKPEMTCCKNGEQQTPTCQSIHCHLINYSNSKLVQMTSHQEAKLLSKFMTVAQAPGYWQAQ